jgi:predicted DNA-binding protein (MmcQ/YjbR family)
MPRPKSTTDAILEELREFGLAYPGAHTKSPWPGHLDLAVKDKTFAYLSIEGQPFSISCKLPESNGMALMLPFAKPTGYGLGKSGWVSASFAEGEVPPVQMLKAWIEESYRAQAPKKLVAALQAGSPPGSQKKAALVKKAAAPAKKAAAPARTRRPRAS